MNKGDKKKKLNLCERWIIEFFLGLPLSSWSLLLFLSLEVVCLYSTNIQVYEQLDNFERFEKEFSQTSGDDGVGDDVGIGPDGKKCEAKRAVWL